MLQPIKPTTRGTRAIEETEELVEVAMVATEVEDTQMETTEEEVIQEEEEDLWITKDGMRNNQEEDRIMNREHGKITKISSGLTGTRTCHREVTLDQTIGQTGTRIGHREVILDQTNGQIGTRTCHKEIITLMSMANQERGKEVQVQEDIQIETVAQEVAKIEEGEIDTLVQEMMEDMVGGVRATTAEETARGPKGMMGPL